MSTPQEEIHGITAEVWRIVDAAQATGWSDPSVTSDLGAIKNYMEQVDVLVDQIPTQPEPGPTPPNPEPEPPSALYTCFAVTYQGHGMASDVYPGTSAEEREYGPHHGHPILAPSPGRVESYMFPTPLNTVQKADPDYARHYDELFATPWICMAPAPVKAPGATEDELPIGMQMMYVAVEWLDTALLLPNGQHVPVIWFGHVKGDIPTGRVQTGGRICTSWDSGVRFENNGIQARAAHIHVCGSVTGRLSQNGDVDGLLVARALGWDVEFRGGNGPGPDQYMSGRYLAGKLASQWGSNPIPPVPAP